MKIIILNNKSDRGGGADVVAMNTAELLYENGHDVIYYSAGSTSTETDGLRYISVKKNASLHNYFYSIRVFLNLFALLKRERPDIAHLHLYHGYLTYSVLHALKFHRIPVVVTLHDYKLICPIQSCLSTFDNNCTACEGKSFFYTVFKKCYKKSFFGSLYKAAEAYFFKYLIGYFRFIKKYVCVSDFSYSLHVKYFGIKNFTRLYNFIPKSNAALLEKDNVFLYFGRISNEKGVLELLDVWKKIKKYSYRLEIMGAGPLTELVEYLIENDPTVSYIGYLNNYNSISNKIARSKYVIVPSKWYENNPLTILESMSNATPVIASRIGGIPELIDDSIDGFLFDPYDKKDFTETLEKAMLVNDDEYLSLANNALQKYNDKFSPNSHYSSLINIYKECIF